MELSSIKVDSSLQMKVIHKMLDLPMQVYTDHYAKYNLKYITWHWHKELEFVFCVKGKFLCRIGTQGFTIHEGKGVFINSSVLHQFEPLTAPEATTSFSICVSPEFMGIAGQNKLYEKYIATVLSNAEFEFCRFSHDVCWQKTILDYLQDIYHIAEKQESLYEFDIQIRWLQIWKLILANKQVYKVSNNADEKIYSKKHRINMMLEYIKNHYTEDITVQNIADSANVSRSECFRTFDVMLGVQPAKFVLYYRLEQALVKMYHTEESITHIALSCGFNSTSYFSTVFRGHFGISPSAYRKHLQNDPSSRYVLPL